MSKGIVPVLVCMMFAVGLVACSGGGSGSGAPSNDNYSISGTVTSSGTGLQGVTMTLSGASSATVTTDSSGNFSFSGLVNGSYSISAGKSGYIFNPASSAQSVNGSNITSVDFTATVNTNPTYTISGTVTLSGAGLSGVTMTLSGAVAGSVSTDASGNYAFAGLANGSYTITPGKTGYAFTPTSSAKTVNGANIASVSFTAAVTSNAATITKLYPLNVDGYTVFAMKSDGSVWALGDNSNGKLGDGTENYVNSFKQVLTGVAEIYPGYYQSWAVKTDGSLWATGENGLAWSQILTGITNLYPLNVDGYTLFAMKSDGSVWALGDNSNGRLGDGTENYVNSFKQVLTGVAEIYPGYYQSWAVKTDGSLWATGENGLAWSQILTGITNLYPLNVDGYTLFAMKSDGSVWALGDNSNGRLGDGTENYVNSFKQVLTGVAEIYPGYYQSWAVKTDGSLWATGENGLAWSQILTGITNLYPLNVDGYTLFAMKSDGSVWALGDNSNGRLGDGTENYVNTFKQVLTGVAEIYPGYYQSWAVKTDGSLWATGENGLAWGQILTGITKLYPLNVDGYTLFAMKSDGSVWALGDNSNGRLGDGTENYVNTFKQVLTGVAEIYPGYYQSWAVKTDGSLWATGENGLAWSQILN